MSRSSRALVITLSLVLALEAVAAPQYAAAALLPAPVSVTRPDAVEVEQEAPDVAEAGEPVELVDQRTETSRTIDNRDGTLTTEIFTQPIHYRPDGTESWEPVAIGFETTDQEGVRAESVRAPVGIVLRDATDPAGFLEVGRDEHRIAFTFAGSPSEPIEDSVGGKVSPAIDDPAVAIYRDVLPDVDLQVHAGAEGPKTFVVLHSPDAGNEFLFGVEASGLALRAAENGAVDLVDDAGESIARMPKPYAVDSSETASAPAASSPTPPT